MRVMKENWQKLKKCLKRRRQRSAKDDLEATALHWAADGGHMDIVKVLLQKGADVNAVQRGKTALHISLEKDMLRL